MSHDSRHPDSAWSDEQLEYLVHDFKNPLGTVLTHLRLLLDRLGDPVDLKLAADGLAAAQRLQRMVLDLLDVGRFRDTQPSLQRIQVRLEDLVEEALAAVQPGADARGVALACDLKQAGELVVRLDFDLMTRVLVNLLDNALRHSPVEGTVEVTAEPHVEGLTLSVCDDGPGVPDDWRERIFERFARHDEGRPDRLGRGLGLAFSKLAAQAHGFDIGVQARTPAGSRFFLFIPAADVATVEAGSEDSAESP